MSPPCEICHVEIPAPDLAAAKRFYARVFGWEISDLPGKRYAFWRAGEGCGGGFDPAMRPSADGVNVVLLVADIPAKLLEIEASGGRVVKPKTLVSEEHGYYATFLDPNGNRLSVWSRT